MAADETEAPQVGEEIHMPDPSLLPILNAVGLSLAIVGHHALNHRHRGRPRPLPRHDGPLDPRRQARDLRAPRGAPRPHYAAAVPSPILRTSSPGAPTRIGCRGVGVDQPDVSSPEIGRPRTALRRSVRIPPRRGRRERARRRLRARPRGRRGAVQRPRLRRRPPPGADGRAHGRARRPAGRDRPGRGGVHPREPVRVRDRRPRLPRGAGDRGIEHEHVKQLRSLADASVAINSSLPGRRSCN